jgi:hypothetical protein
LVITIGVRGGVTDIWWAEARNTVRHSTMNSNMPHSRNYPFQMLVVLGGETIFRESRMSNYTCDLESELD